MWSRVFARLCRVSSCCGCCAPASWKLCLTLTVWSAIRRTAGGERKARRTLRVARDPARAPLLRVGDTPMWITPGLETDARRRPGHNNDPSLKESACLEDTGRPTKTHRSATGMNSGCFSACSTLVTVDWIQLCCGEVVRRFHLTGTSTGASLFFTKNTTNLAGFVVLALRPTT